MPHLDDSTAFRPLQLGVITLSDSRTLETDTSGEYLCEALGNAGHTLSRRVLIADDKDLLHSTLIQWSAAPDIDVILTTGGTGITRRDITPEIVESLATKLIPGFGELFRMQSFKSIGTSTIQSRAVGALIDTTLVFALPGSTGACRDAWTGILVHQLDSRFRPCNFAELLSRL
ncbi:MAG: molybdenum cofactor biosynthesis protein B [Myxococcota bacterium]|jgi:molybdenum cofactor biosynthesis protein B